jgi:hypothetical protein
LMFNKIVRIRIRNKGTLPCLIYKIKNATGEISNWSCNPGYI